MRKCGCRLAPEAPGARFSRAGGAAIIYRIMYGAVEPMGGDMGQKQPPRAFAEERRAAIMSILDESSSVQVADLAGLFGVSTVTVRNDLDALERDGKLRRTYGGAVSLRRRVTVSVQEGRAKVNGGTKRAIARAAISLIDDGDLLLVDSGTTALEFVRLLGTRRGITVATADITIADFIDENLPGVDAILLGGALRKAHRYLYGPLTTAAIASLQPDKAVVCPAALIPDRGLMASSDPIAEVKTASIHAARESIALVDASKVNADSLIRFARITDVHTVVMDDDPNGTVAHAFSDAYGEAAPRLLLASMEV